MAEVLLREDRLGGGQRVRVVEGRVGILRSRQLVLDSGGLSEARNGERGE